MSDVEFGDERLPDKFWAKVVETGSCWEWNGNKVYGYGQFYFNGKSRRAHRLILSVVQQPETKGLDACHHCDNRGCVNPKHLFWGTRSDNMKDCLNKGRAWVQTNRVEARAVQKKNRKKQVGEKHPHIILNLASTTALIKEFLGGAKYKTLSERYGISRSTVAWLVKGRSHLARAALTAIRAALHGEGK